MWLDSSRFPWVLAGVMVLLAVCSGSFDAVGLFEDEGIYESTAQSMIEGRGYTIGTLPASPPNAKYPFLYPTWIAVQKWLAPAGAESALIKLSNFVLFLALVGVFERTLRVQFKWQRRRSRLAAAFLGICALMLNFSTVAMTEIPFALCLWLMVRELCRDGGALKSIDWRWVFVLGTALYYLRTAAVAPMAAVIAILAMRRDWRRAALLASGWIVAALPWIFWSKQAAAAFAAGDPVPAQLLSYHVSYDFHWRAIADIARAEGWAEAIDVWSSMVFSNAGMFLESVGDVFLPIGPVYSGSLADPPAILSIVSLACGVAVIAIAALGYRRSEMRSKQIVGLVAIFYIALLIAWPWPFGARFLVPVVPIMVLFVVENVQRWSERMALTRLTLIGASFALQVLATLSVAPGSTMWRKMAGDDAGDIVGMEWLKTHCTGNDVLFSGLDSQWLSRQLRMPVVGYNTNLSPSSALQMHFREASRGPHAQFARGLNAWNAWAKARSGRVYILSNPSLNGSSRRTLRELEETGLAEKVFEEKDFDTKIYRYLGPPGG